MSVIMAGSVAAIYKKMRLNSSSALHKCMMTGKMITVGVAIIPILILEFRLGERARRWRRVYQ
jgi:hypothetical protein